MRTGLVAKNNLGIYARLAQMIKRYFYGAMQREAGFSQVKYGAKNKLTSRSRFLVQIDPIIP
jgi:hypothetical protein